MHFQIYIPGASDLLPELEKAGLGDFVAGAEVLREAAGPDGHGGAVFAWWNPRCRQIGYRPDEQTWLKSREGYWVGIWNASPPTPEELARTYQEQGQLVTLGDGNRWLVPQIERLDRSMVLADDGSWRFEVQRRHHKLWLESCAWAARFVEKGDGRTSIDLGELADFLVGVLRLNYRLTREIAAALKLFTTNTIAAPFSAVLGQPIRLGAGGGGDE